MERSQIMPVATDAFLPGPSLLAQSCPTSVDELAVAIKSDLATPVSTIIHADTKRLIDAAG